MKTISLKNYRCFEDTGDIQIKPINFLVGANSSGKSSFLKFFPLLKQSEGKKLHGPLLWNGDYVDLKDFNNTVRKGAKTMEISMLLGNVKYLQRLRYKSSSLKKVRLSFCIESDSDNTNLDYITSISINLIDVIIKLDFKKDNVSVTVGNVNSEFFKESIGAYSTVSLLPHLIFNTGNRGGDESSLCLLQLENKVTKQNADKSRNPIWRLLVGPVFSYKKFKENLGVIIDKTEEEYRNLYELSVYYNLNNILDSINVHLLGIARNITYIGPLRKSTQRYYSYQNLSVDEIDPDGSNLAMYLANLRTEELNSLNKWISRLFRFSISVHSVGGHIELLVKEQEQEDINLVDIGFGYTQFLPILVDIWKIIYGEEKLKDNDYERIIAIEQPELHLHPRLQSLFADLLGIVISDAKVRNKDVRFIIETHSETILNRIGERIDSKYISSNDVNVVLFNAIQEQMENYVEVTNYTSDGYLEKWPINFFY